MDFPVQIQNVLSTRSWCLLQNHIDNEPWFRNNSDYDPKLGLSWTHRDKQSPVYYDVGVTMSLRVRKYLKRKLKIVKIHVNGQTMGQMSNFHQDSCWDDVWTCVLFTSPSWNTNHGGEFTTYDPIQERYKSVSYIPNTAALFPANWDHRGAPPLIPDAGMRTSLAVTFCAAEIEKEFLEAHPNLAGFANYG